jgi:hypothetical protein
MSSIMMVLVYASDGVAGRVSSNAGGARPSVAESRLGAFQKFVFGLGTRVMSSECILSCEYAPVD